MKCLFMIASQYGLECLHAVRNIVNIEVCGIVTPGKKYVLKYGEEKKRDAINPIINDLMEIAEKQRIKMLVMKKMNDGCTEEFAKECNPDLIVVVGWYHYIGKRILDIPRKGVIGLHASLLPRYKGGAPLVWQMINGEKETGISLFYMTEMMDAGDIIGQKYTPILEEDDIHSLYKRVGRLGIELLTEQLPLIEEGISKRIKQEISEESIFPQRSEEDGVINWNSSARDIYNFVRAQTRPYPGAYTLVRGRKIRVWRVQIVEADDIKGCYEIINIDDWNLNNCNQSENRTIIKTDDKCKSIEILEWEYA